MRKGLDKILRRHLLLFEKDAISELDVSRERVLERLKPLKRRTSIPVSPSSDDPSRNTHFSRHLTPARIAACLVAVLLAAAVLYRAVIRPDDLYAIVETSGGSVVQISQGRALSANVGDKIAVDTPVRTGSGAGAKLKLPDGSRIEMQPESELSWHRANDGLHIQLKEGGVNVTPAEEAAGKLYVQNREQVVPILAATFQSVTAPLQSEITPKWDVVSVKPCDNSGRGDSAPGGGGGARAGGGGAADNGPNSALSGRLTIRCMRLRGLILTAYVEYANPKSPDSFAFETAAAMHTVEGGPGWIDSESFTIEAKAEGPADIGMMRGPMLQAILEDRFKLRFRREVRQVPVLALTVAKGGPKMKPHQEGSCTPYGQGQRGVPPPGTVFCKNVGRGNGYEAEGLSVEQFSRSYLMVGIMYQEGRPIIDKTGLTGKFDFKVERKDIAQNAERPDRAFDAAALILAIEDQLGLKLEKTQGPWEHFVIDHVERPSPN